MVVDADRRIHIDTIRSRYGNDEAIWDTRDSWHAHTGRQIRRYLSMFHDRWVANRVGLVLNAGYGGTRYLPASVPQIDIDLMSERLMNSRCAVRADVHALPFRAATFRYCICVGSVLNYTEPTVALPELARVLEPGGMVVLEFDTTDSMEFAFSHEYAAAAHLATTFYKGTPEQIWLYSIRLITAIANGADLDVVDHALVHTVSSLLLRVKASPAAATRFALLDRLCRLLPVVGETGSNVLITFRKRS